MKKRCTEQEDREGIECLPDEILLDIFSKLPLISILRARCTSKRWCKLMADPEFTDMHFIRATLNPGHLYLYSHDCNLYYSEKSSAETITVFRDTKDSSLLYTGHASSGGLMACYAWNEQCYYIFNPFLEERAKVPVSPMHKFDSLWGFGYSPSTKEYKIVQFGRRFLLESLGVGIYTLGSESWTQVPNVALPPADQHVDCDGTLFWLIRSRFYRRGPETVMSFDAGSEKLRAWRGPIFEVIPRPDSKVFHLVKFDDSVGCVLNEQHCINIWILRDKVRDIWINEYKFVLKSPLRSLKLKFLGIWMNHLLFSGEDRFGKSISVCYDAEKEKFKVIEMPFRNYFEKKHRGSDGFVFCRTRRLMQLEPHLSAGTSTGRIYLYGNQHTRKVRIGRPVQKVQIDKDCSFVYATAENRLYHIPTDHFSEGDVFGYIPQDACISDFCIHPVRPELYTASGDGKILLYDLRSSLAYHTWNHTLGIASIGFIPTKKLIITGDISGNIQFWCQESGRRLFENLVYPSPITTISVFPDETFFCVGTYSGDMATWSLGMCRVLSLLLPSDPIKRCILHERSRGMVAASSREIAVWEPAGMEKRISHPVEKELTCFKVSNLNPRAFAGFEDGSIAAIRLDSGLHKPFLDSLRGAIRCIGIYGL